MKRWLALAALAAAVPGHAGDRAGARASLASGVEYFFAGNMRAARIEALNAVKADRDWGLANAFLARTQVALGDGAGAEASLDRAAKAGFAEVRLGHLRAHAALIEGDARRALALSAVDTASPRTSGYAARVAASALVALGDVEGAARAYDAAAGSDPNSSLLWTDIGRFRLSRGDVAGAGAAAERAAALNPNNIEALILSGQIVRGQYGPVASLVWFDRALEIDSASLPALGEAAATLGDIGRYGAMLTRTRRMLAIEPDNPQALYLQAVMAARAGQYPLARSLVYRTRERMAGVPGMRLLQGVLALAAGSAEQAAKHLEPLAWTQRTNLVARRLHGLALLRAGENEKAFHRFAVIGDRADADSYTLLSIARMQEEIGNARGAALLRDRAARGDAVRPPVFDLTGAFRLDEAAAGDAVNADVAVPRIARLVGEGQAGEALGLARAIAARNRGSAAAQMLLGDVLDATGDLVGAARAYRAAANIEFSQNVALRLASALGRAGRRDAALLVLQTFLAQNPRNLPAQLLAADHLLAAGRWREAATIFESLRQRIGNRDATLLAGLGWAYANGGSPARGGRFLDAAYALAPGNPLIAGATGWARYESGRDKEGGRALIVKAARIAPDNPQIRDWLAESIS